MIVQSERSWQTLRVLILGANVPQDREKSQPSLLVQALVVCRGELVFEGQKEIPVCFLTQLVFTKKFQFRFSGFLRDGAGWGNWAIQTGLGWMRP